jgi:hypothetical protein
MATTPEPTLDVFSCDSSAEGFTATEAPCPDQTSNPAQTSTAPALPGNLGQLAAQIQSMSAAGTLDMDAMQRMARGIDPSALGSLEDMRNMINDLPLSPDILLPLAKCRNYRAVTALFKGHQKDPNLATTLDALWAHLQTQTPKVQMTMCDLVLAHTPDTLVLQHEQFHKLRETARTTARKPKSSKSQKLRLKREKARAQRMKNKR